MGTAKVTGNIVPLLPYRSFFHNLLIKWQLVIQSSYQTRHFFITTYKCAVLLFLSDKDFFTFIVVIAMGLITMLLGCIKNQPNPIEQQQSDEENHPSARGYLCS